MDTLNMDKRMKWDNIPLDVLVEVSAIARFQKGNETFLKAKAEITHIPCVTHHFIQIGRHVTELGGSVAAMRATCRHWRDGMQSVATHLQPLVRTPSPCFATLCCFNTIIISLSLRYLFQIYTGSSVSLHCIPKYHKRRHVCQGSRPRSLSFRTGSPLCCSPPRHRHQPHRRISNCSCRSVVKAEITEASHP